MGWTGVYQRVDDPRLFLDAELTHGQWSVLRSAIAGTGQHRAYYAALAQDGDTRRVLGVVVLFRQGGGVFEFKVMDESMGPHASACPRAILDLLDPTPPTQWAAQWRARCGWQPSLIGGTYAPAGGCSWDD